MYDLSKFAFLFRFCLRSDQGRIITSSGPFMKLNFKTDRSISRKGFKIEIKAVCGTYLSAEQGVISSPGFPNNYGNNLDCFYGIRVRPGRTLTFWFDTMNVTSSNTGKNSFNE